jgi:hypothetical protein
MKVEIHTDDEDITHHMNIMACMVIAPFRQRHMTLTTEQALIYVDMIASPHTEKSLIFCVVSSPTAMSGIAPGDLLVNARPETDLGKLLRLAFAPDSAACFDTPRSEFDLNSSHDAKALWVESVLRPFIERCGLSDGCVIT